ncbi:branched-chain amino acid ABC transporter permease [Azospirillum sp.]|uniref:branched-chain amino acid ABC transporter permease n=1 Tax=Azospirillum sp. TaxID=34012 RepID=UPI002D24D5EC|nr:branched-chain amino acid ABC transporter permease [Azospirillum sp.]HYD67350.1 branched-chain amino acid ABC transporter permease [Azospirillum sp.]
MDIGMDILAQTLAQGLLMGGTYALIALGMGLTFSVSGVVNFAHGDILSLGMFLAFACFNAFALDPYVSVAITLPVMLGLGALLYRGLLKPVVGSHTLMVIQLTLGITFVLQNGLLMTFGGLTHRVPSMIEAELILVGDTLVLRAALAVAFVVCVALAGLLYWMLMRTDLGRSIRAVHQNARAAALMGVNVNRVRMLTFAMGCGLLAIAAALLVPGTPLHPSQGLRYTVITLMVMVLGGMTNFLGILVGGLLFGITEALGTVYVSGTSGMIVPYAMFVLVLLLRPEGLLKGRAA